MRSRFLCLLSSLIFLAGCTGTTSTTSAPTPSVRTYNGTASVGDFMTITIDSAAHTLSFVNLTNSTSGVIPYTTTGNGVYTLSDPTGNLIAAYEVPGYALLIDAQKAGPNQDTPALVTAVESGTISLSTFTNKSYNYIQFRTASGGLEVGSVAFTASSGHNSSYWPYGALNQGSSSPFNTGTIDLSGATQSSSGTYLALHNTDSVPAETDYVFGTSGGFFMVDSTNGAIIGLQKSSSAAFSSSFAGSYTGMFYRKTGASTGQGNVESGTPSLSQAAITVDASGGIVIKDAANNTLGSGALIPVSSASYLYDGTSSKLADPCNGLFTVRIVTANSQQDLFATFIGNAVVFASFEAATPWNSSNGTYNYFYGVGLR